MRKRAMTMKLKNWMAAVILFCCPLLLSSCFDTHPYDVNFKGELGINRKQIEVIQTKFADKDTLRVAFISDSHFWLSDLYGDGLMFYAIDSIYVKEVPESKYDERVLRYRKHWAALIPTRFVIQNAGNMGQLSAGIGWGYGRNKIEDSYLPLKDMIGLSIGIKIQIL